MERKILLIGCWFYCVLFLSCSLCAQEYPLIRRLSGHNAAVNAINFSPTGKSVASVSKDQTLKIWDMKSSKELFTLGHTSHINAIAYSSDGNLIASAGTDKLIKIWRANEGKLLYTLNEHKGNIYDIKFSPDSKQLISSGENNNLFIWDVKKQKKLKNIRLEETVLSLDFSPDGRYLALGYWNGNIQLWDAQSFEVLHTLTTHFNQIYSIAFSPDGNYIASAGADKLIHIWDLQTNELLKTLKGHHLAIYDIGFSPDMNFLVSGGRDRTLNIWNIQKGIIEKSINHKHEITSVDFSPNGKLVASGSKDGILRVFLRPNTSKAIVSENQSISVNNNHFIGKSEVDFRLPPFQGSNPDAIAVVIGNKDYIHRDIPPVDFAHQDAGSIRKYLIEVFGFQEENIIYLPNAKLGDFTGTFGTINNHQARLFNLVKANKSDVFVYYSGHGAPNIDDRIAYFVPTDCDPSLLAFQGYSTQTLYQNLAKIPYKSLTVVIDACFSGGSEKGSLIKGASPVFIKPKIPIIRKHNAQILSAAKGTQFASWYPLKSHSMFTYYYLKGLQGAADKNRDAQLTLTELNDYLSEEVSYMARKLKNRKQEPVIYGEGNQVILTY